MSQTLSNNLIKLSDLAPFARNDNVNGSAIRDKVGPHGITWDGFKWRAYVETVDGTTDLNPGTFTYPTGLALITSMVPQGPWTFTQANRLLDPLPSPSWETSEASPSSSHWDVANNRWVIWYHGGNNPGPRKTGVLYSTDGFVGRTFVRDTSNPILTIGTTGASDDKGVTDLKIRQMSDGSYLGFYCGRQTGGPVNGTIHRVTGTSPNVLTKQGEVIAEGIAGTWNYNGMYPGFWWVDPDNRIHMFAMGSSADNSSTGGGCGYFWSDNNGVSWTEYGSNPIMAKGAAGAYDEDTFDVGQGGYDGDVLFITTGGESQTYAVNPPLRGQCMAITPARVASPRRTGKFYLPDASRSYSEITATSVLTQTVFSFMGRFKAYRIDRSATRSIWAEAAAFNITAYAHLNKTAAGAPGFLECWFRTPTAFTTQANLRSLNAVDDGRWHTFLVRRTATAKFELWLDGVLQGTDSTDISTDATTTTKSIGNWVASTGNPDEPGLMTISDFVTVHGTAVTWDQAVSIVENRSFPGGVSATIDFPTAGTDNGSVALVEARPWDPSVAKPIVASGTRRRSRGTVYDYSRAGWFSKDFISGAGLFDASMISTGVAYTAAITEAGSATDSASVTAAFASSATESGSATDSASTTASFVSDATESASASDAPSAAASFVSSISESTSATDDASGSRGQYDNVTESGSASDSASVVAAFVSDTTESGSATDSASTAASFVSAQTESTTASEVADAAATYIRDITESGSPADSSSAAAAFVSDTAESGSATDSASATVSTSSEATESGSATDDSSAIRTQYASADESGSAADTSNTTAAFVSDASESASASDTPAAVAAFASSITESTSATEDSSGSRLQFGDTTESGSASDSASAVAAFVGDASESGSATDASSTTAAFVSDATEAGSATDSASALAAFAATITESASATDEALTGLFDGVEESGNASDSASAAGSFVASQAESASAADTNAVTQFSAISEAGSATDSASGAVTYPVSASESASASDSEDSLLSALATQTEAASASDSASAIATFGATVTESATATDSAAAVAAFIASVLESATASDSESANNATSSDITESTSATDTSSWTFTTFAAISEDGSATDASTTVYSAFADIEETATATEVASAIADFVADITESANATDTYEPGTNFIITVTEAANATDVCFVIEFDREDRRYTVRAQTRLVTPSGESRIATTRGEDRTDSI